MKTPEQWIKEKQGCQCVHCQSNTLATIDAADIAAIQSDAQPQWQPIETAPRDGTYILLAAPSGYTTTPLRVEVGHWVSEYRPHNPWQTHSNDAFSDGGGQPTHWMPLPQMPTKGEA